MTLKPPETRHIRDDPFGHRFRELANTSEREHYKTYMRTLYPLPKFNLVQYLGKATDEMR